MKQFMILMCLSCLIGCTTTPVESEIAELKRENKILKEENQSFRGVFNELEKRYGITVTGMDRDNESDVPQIEGKVIEILADNFGNKKYILNVGSDNNVKPYYKFTVFRNDNYKAKLVVEKVMKQRSECLLLPESVGRDKNGDLEKISIDDLVCTQIY